jgi:uncharacterized delta-60 repeat protein
MIKWNSQMLRKAICFALLLVLLPPVSVPAAGYLDPLFGTAGGYVQLPGFAPSTSIRADGRILTFTTDHAIARLAGLASEGALDASFGDNGLLTLPSGSGAEFTIAPDGKIIVASPCGLEGDGLGNDVSLQRLLSNGDPDPSFHGGSPVCRSVNAMAPLFGIHQVLVQPDGKLLVLATNVFAGDSIVGYSILARFDEQGNLDPLFGTNGTFVPNIPYPPGGSSLGIRKMILRSGGQILLLGTVSNWRSPFTDPQYLVLVRLTSQGGYDPGFDGDGMFIYYHPGSYITGCDMAVQLNGRILIVGSEDTAASSTDFLLGLAHSGAIDTGFGNAGFTIVPETMCNVLVLPNDAILTAGFADPNLIVRMFTPEGAPYTAFASGGMVSYDFLAFPFDLDLQPNGKIILTTSNNVDATFVARIAPLFEDVSFVHWAWGFIERLYNAGITGGCATGPLRYCPEQTVTRAQMAVFLLRGRHGSSYTPPAVGSATGFGDVPPDYWAAGFIKQLAVEGITSGCGGGNYCPEAPVTRAQMAVFLLRSKYGASYTPPAVGSGTGFGDVPPSYWAAAFVKQLVTEGITAGCGAGNYCPESPVTRAQMAVFLVRTFSLP